jgi:hypothetical protein
MSSTEDYRRYARECMELLCVVNDQKTKAILSHMAQVWLRLANQKHDPGATLKDEQPGESPRKGGSQPELEIGVATTLQ